jgi:hypothetical protein
VSVFHVKPIYYLHRNGQWRPLAEVTAHHGNRTIALNDNWTLMHPSFLKWLMRRAELLQGSVLLPFPDLRTVREGVEMHFATSTFYPDPDPETTTVDGNVYMNRAADSGMNWVTLISQATGEGKSDASTNDWAFNILHGQTLADTWRRCARSIFLFDTSALSSEATITAAVLSLYGTQKNDDNNATPDLDIYTVSPASNTSIALSDYGSFGSTSQTGSPIAYASMSATGYNDFTLNATGRGNVNKTGISKFGARNANYDVAAVTPNAVVNASSNLFVNFADISGTSTDPKLVVSYEILVPLDLANSFQRGVKIIG